MIAESPAPNTLRTDGQNGQKKWTYDEIAAIPDERLRELHDGRPILMPSPTTQHQELYRALVRFIERWLEAGGQGLLYYQPIDLKIDNYKVLIPDLIYYATEDAASVKSKNRKYLSAVPDLVVEIISPSSAKTDRVYKSETYAAIGVTYYWIIDPITRVFQAFRLVDGEYRFEANLPDEGEFKPVALPGLTLPMAELFGPRDADDESE